MNFADSLSRYTTHTHVYRRVGRFRNTGHAPAESLITRAHGRDMHVLFSYVRTPDEQDDQKRASGKVVSRAAAPRGIAPAAATKRRAPACGHMARAHVSAAEGMWQSGP